MPNFGGPLPGKKRLIGSVVNSVLLYAAPIWKDALVKARNRATMVSVKRSVALRIIRAYRTVSAEAALVLAGVIPCDLLAAERARTMGTGVNREERERTIRKLQEVWDRSPKGNS